jgi:hypothetical protein
MPDLIQSEVPLTPPFFPLIGRGRPINEVAFWERVSIGNSRDCWPWGLKLNRDGYGAYAGIQAHRVAWTLHHGRHPGELLVCHRCDNRACCNPSHLFLGTHADNHRDRNEKGRQAKGERHGRAKLTNEQARDVRSLYRQGIAIRRLAREYHVTPKAIRCLVKGATWTSVFIEGGRPNG